VGLVGAQAVAVTVEVDDDASVQEPVEHGGGEHVIAEDAAPAGDSPVGGEHDAGLEVALADDLEQRRGGVGGQRQVAQLVDLCGCPHRSTYAEPATMPRRPTDGFQSSD